MVVAAVEAAVVVVGSKRSNVIGLQHAVQMFQLLRALHAGEISRVLHTVRNFKVPHA